MPSPSEWNVSTNLQPKPADYAYDLDRALASMVAVKSLIPSDGTTADVLGTERLGNGVLINDRGVILTIGYLVTEAETIWITLIDGRVVPGHVLAYDAETGFGLVQALARIDLPPMPIGSSADAEIGARVVMAGAGGRQRSVAARIVAKQEFAGYWEYLLDEAIYTAPAHPHWGGAALIDHKGELIGIGSLQLQHAADGEDGEYLNMIVPIDLLKPILDDMLKYGRVNRPAHPWLGLYSTEVEDQIIVAGLANRGPAQRAGLKTGDVVLAVDDEEVNDLADFYRKVRALGSAGVTVPLRIYRDGKTFEERVTSIDRTTLFKPPSMH